MNYRSSVIPALLPAMIDVGRLVVNSSVNLSIKLVKPCKSRVGSIEDGAEASTGRDGVYGYECVRYMYANIFKCTVFF